MNIKSEFEAITARFEGQELKLGKFDHDLKQSNNELDNKVEQVKATIRVIQSDINA